MNNALEQKCRLLLWNHDAMSKAFRWDNGSMMLAGSSFFVGMNLEADTEKLKECAEVLKQKTGPFSAFRGNIRMPLICKMAVSENPEQYFENVNAIVQQMKPLKWISADYKILTALTLRDYLEMEEILPAINKMTNLYRGMKNNHPWITSDEDIPFAAILVVSGLDTDVLLAEMETCYELLAEKFRDKNAVQSLSHIMAVNPADAAAKCQKVENIFDTLKTNRHKYGSGYELAVLGTLSMLDLPEAQIAQEIIEADDYLKKAKGFGKFSMGDNMRRMYAALMVMDAHMPPASHSHESLVSAVLALVIAMEICMVILMTSVVLTTTAN